MPPKNNNKRRGEGQQSQGQQGVQQPSVPQQQVPQPIPQQVVQQVVVEPQEPREEQFAQVKKERGAKKKAGKGQQGGQQQQPQPQPQQSKAVPQPQQPQPKQAKAKSKQRIELGSNAPPPGLPQQQQVPPQQQVPQQQPQRTTTTSSPQPQQQQVQVQPQQQQQPLPSQSPWGRNMQSVISGMSGMSVSTGSQVQQQQQQQQQQQPQQQPVPQQQQQQQPQRTTTTTTTTTSSSITPKPSTNIMDALRVRDEDAQNLAVRVNPTKQYPPVDLYCNQFLTKFNKKNIYQYQVEFAPIQETRSAKRQCVDKIGSHFNNIFKYDGSALIFSIEEVENKNFHLENGVSVSITKVAKIGHDDSKSMQFLNVLFKQFLRDLKLTIIGRQYYNSLQKTTIDKYGIEIWPGFFTSINHIEAGTSLLCDVAHKVVRTTSVLQKISNMLKNRHSQNDVNESLVGSIIITKYNNKTYRISGVRWNMKVSDRMASDNPMSFKQYYDSHYPKSKITDLTQPLLESKVKRAGQVQTIFLIPELSYLTGLDDEITSDRHLMMDLAQIKFVQPRERRQKLEEFVGSLEKHPKIQEELKKWDISFSSSLPVTGGQLPEPTTVPQKGLLRNVKWVLVVSQRDQDEVLRFVDILMRESGLPEPRIINPRTFNPKAFCEEIPNLKGYAFFFMVINNQANFYDLIKQNTLIQLKVITQCAQLRTLSKGRPVAVKIYHQLAAKLGMSPWILRNSNFSGIPTKKTMLVGIDVTHNTTSRGSSIVGIVASLNEEFSCFHTEAILQNKPGKEIVETLQPAFTKALQAYTKKNNYLPELIIVYRDGVGDGMINLVRKFEVDAIVDAIKASPSIYGGKPKLVYTIVKKNTNTRFFRRDNGDNPNPGTVVERGCVRKDWYDFFLVSQKALQGSVNPTHYHVVYDEAKIPSNDFQYFTYANCFLYYNFDKAVSVPAVTQYAHKLAFLIGRHVHSSVSNDLSKNLYFL